MTKFTQKIKHFLHPHPILSWMKTHKKATALIAVIVVGGAFMAGRASEPEVVEKKQRIAKVDVIDLQEYRDNARSVSASGQVEALEQVELRSEATGRIVYMNVSVGDTVRPGQVLLGLNAGSLSAQLQQARADLESIQATRTQLEAALDAQKAKLADLQRGPKPEELTLAQTQVAKAEQDLANEYADVKTVLKSAQSDVIEIIYQNIDDFFTNPRTSDPALTFGTDDQFLKIQVQGGRRRIEEMLPIWDAEINSITAVSSQAEIDAKLELSITNINLVRTFLDNMTSAIIDITGVGDSTQTSYLAIMDSVRGTVNSALASIDNQKQSISSQKLVVKQTKDSLAITQAGNTSETIQVQQSAVDQAEANLVGNSAAIKRANGVIYGIQAELVKTVVRSPIRGTISTLAPRAGEYLTSGALVANIVNTNGLQVKAHIDSDDLWMVKKGASVKINEKFDGEVLSVAPSIDPATKKVEVRIALNTDDSAGTAPVVGQYVDVVIASNVLEDGTELNITLPLQAINTQGDRAFVYTVNQEGIVELKQVELGDLSGVEVEIKTDLSELDVILANVRGISVGDKVEIKQ